jgi:formate hydrogenlyase subunit 4
LQPLKDLVRLFKKGSVYSQTTSILFQIAPSVYLASIIMAVLVIPLGRYKGILSFEGDFVFFAYVLGVGKFFSIISAMDTGSSFEGMGASREALFSMFVEPAFFLLMGSFAFFCLTHRSNFLSADFLFPSFRILRFLCPDGACHLCPGHDRAG